MALVTGASRGLGKVCAVEFARAGFRVAVSARTLSHSDERRLPGNLETTVQAISDTGAEGLAVKMDLDDRTAVVAGLEAVMARWGRIDVLQIAFTQTLGTQAFENNGVPQPNGEKQAIFKVSLDATVNPIGEYLRTSFFWHLDGSMHEVPILASILSARYLPRDGGATEWCNTYAAYDALPPSEKERIEGLKVLHANWALQRFVNPHRVLHDLAGRDCHSGPCLPAKRI